MLITVIVTAALTSTMFCAALYVLGVHVGSQPLNESSGKAPMSANIVDGKPVSDPRGNMPSRIPTALSTSSIYDPSSIATHASSSPQKAVKKETLIPIR